jgi:hypothetical protein
MAARRLIAKGLSPLSGAGERFDLKTLLKAAEKTSA